MLALQITSMKQFMSQLLASETFDPFLLEEATIATATTMTIDGHLNKDFFASLDSDENQAPGYDFMPWSNLKGLCFQLIKGKRTPLFFKFVFHLKPELTEKLLLREKSSVEPDQIRALLLMIKYDGSKAVLTTGTATTTFLLTKEPDQIWDRTLMRYLAQKGISTEVL